MNTATDRPIEPIPPTDSRALRAALKEAMPAGSFEPQPWRGIVALACVPPMIAIGWAVGYHELPWWLSLPLSFVLGQLLTSIGLAAHEALHHSVFRSRFMEDVIGWIGFSPWLVTPGTWRAWHVQAHHSASNIHTRDPDILPRLEEWRSRWFARLFYYLSAGSRSWISYAGFSFFFTAQGQAFLWYHANEPAFRHLRFSRLRERVLTVLLALGWIALGWTMGLRGALYALIIPQLISNATLMIYIATNHWLQPAGDQHNNPFINTSSVATNRVMDVIHLNFSYHQEHHIFPAMSPRFAPSLRAALRDLNPKASIVYPHFRALRALYARPPLYAADGKTLISPDGTRSIDAGALRASLEQS